MSAHSQMPLLPDDVVSNTPSTEALRRPGIPRAVPFTSPPPDVKLTLSDTERSYWVAWSRIRGVGPARFERLMQYFGDPQSAWSANRVELHAALNEEKIIGEIIRQRAALDPQALLEQLAKHNVAAVTLRDSGYPALLRQIPNPPFVLYVRGSLTVEDEAAIAIVGTRRITPYGRQVTAKIAHELTEQHITVVSGLAHGVDREAHNAALDAGGRTIAVLGCGVDIVYPPQHIKLAERIVENGAIVSDYPLGVAPEAANFPARNRIISGLSLAVVVTEAPEQSGALITANFAVKEHNREVMAVPGTIFSTASKGCNQLIQEGAHCVTSTADIITHLNLFLLPQQISMREVLPSDETEAAIFALLMDEGSHVDEISRATNMPAAQVASVLMMMEIKGMVRNLGGMCYARA
jgi:DNA processing protein